MFAYRTLLAPIAAATLLILAACGGDSPTASASVVGTFALETVNGKALPYVLADSAFQGSAVRVEVVSPSMMKFKSDMSFQFILTMKVSASGVPLMVEADTATGTYSLTGRQLSMTASGSTIRADWDGANSLVLNATPNVLVFGR